MLRILDLLVVHRRVSLAAVALLAIAAHSTAHNWSWHYIETGVHTLFSPDGWHIYSLHPELQMGPVTFLLAAVFVLVLHASLGTAAATGFMMAVGLLAVHECSALSPQPDIQAKRRWFLSSVLVLIVWGEVAVHWGHLDDAMALLGGLLALRLARSGHPVWSAVVIGLAINFKPWAVPFAAILLLAPRRQWVPATVLVALIVLAAWGGFLLFDPAVISAAHFTIPVNPASTLGLFGVDGRTPAWCRPAQLLGGAVLAVLAVRRGRWPAILLVVIALRLLLDPEVKNYYDSGLVLAAAVFDVTATATLLPFLTLAATIGIYLPSYVLASEPVPRAVLRTGIVLTLLAVGLVATPRVLGGPGPAHDAVARDALRRAGEPVRAPRSG